MMKTIGWVLIACGFLWITYTAWDRPSAYQTIIRQNHAGIPQKASFTQDDMHVAINAVGNDVLYYEHEKGWTVTPAIVLLVGAVFLSGCFRKENVATLRRVARAAAWIVACLVPVVVAFAIWTSRFHGILPITPSQRAALRAALRSTVRIEIHRGGDSPSVLVITNASAIQRFAESMTPRRQSFGCLCMGTTRTSFIDTQGHTNVANITDKYIKFGGPWAKDVVFRMYQAVPPRPLLDLMTEYERELDRGAQPTPGGDSQPAQRGSRTPQE